MGPELDVEVVPAEMNAQDQLEVLCLNDRQVGKDAAEVHWNAENPHLIPSGIDLDEGTRALEAFVVLVMEVVVGEDVIR